MAKLKAPVTFPDGTTQSTAGLISPLTTQDDLIVAGSGGTPDRLGKGSDGQVLTVDPTTHHLAWKTPSGLTNPMTNAGDIIRGGLAGAPTRVGVGSDTQVLTVNGSTPAWLDPPRADTGTVAARPSAARAGRTYLPSDSVYLERDTGSAWGVWGPLYPLKEPVPGDFAWVNQGSSTLETTYGGMHMVGASAGGENWRLQTKTAPSTPYTLTCALLPLPDYAGSNQGYEIGIGFRESSSGKLHLVFLYFVGAMHLYTTKYTNPTTFSAHYTNLNNVLALGTQPLWLQISDNGTNRICRFGNDGRHWIQLHSIGRTDFLTADHLVWGVNANGSAPQCWLISWAES